MVNDDSVERKGKDQLTDEDILEQAWLRIGDVSKPTTHCGRIRMIETVLVW